MYAYISDQTKHTFKNNRYAEGPKKYIYYNILFTEYLIIYKFYNSYLTNCLLTLHKYILLP